MNHVNNNDELTFMGTMKIKPKKIKKVEMDWLHLEKGGRWKGQDTP